MFSRVSGLVYFWGRFSDFRVDFYCSVRTSRKRGGDPTADQPLTDRAAGGHCGLKIDAYVKILFFHQERLECEKCVNHSSLLRDITMTLAWRCVTRLPQCLRKQSVKMEDSCFGLKPISSPEFCPGFLPNLEPRVTPHSGQTQRACAVPVLFPPNFSIQSLKFSENFRFKAKS